MATTNVINLVELHEHHNIPEGYSKYFSYVVIIDGEDFNEFFTQNVTEQKRGVYTVGWKLKEEYNRWMNDTIGSGLDWSVRTNSVRINYNSTAAWIYLNNEDSATLFKLAWM